MADAIWYYAKHDQQHGPISAAQLKGMATSGEILPTDLVWKEGMDDWTPAGEVKGLCPQASKPATEPTTATKPADEPAPSEKPPTTETAPATVPAATSSSRWANAPPPATGSSSGGIAPPEPPLTTVRPVNTNHTKARTTPRPEPQTTPFSLPSWLGPGLAICGLLLVIGIRGCDSLGQRSAERLVARAAVSKSHFEDTWTAKRLELETERERIQASQENGLRKEADLETIAERLKTLDTDKQKEKSRLERERWRELEIAARDAQADNTMWAFWRQLCFVPATLVLVAGLLMVATTHDGPPRWICLIVLAILVYSLFVGGAAWQ